MLRARRRALTAPCAIVESSAGRVQKEMKHATGGSDNCLFARGGVRLNEAVKVQNFEKMRRNSWDSDSDRGAKENHLGEEKPRC